MSVVYKHQLIMGIKMYYKVNLQDLNQLSEYDRTVLSTYERLKMAAFVVERNPNGALPECVIIKCLGIELITTIDNLSFNKHGK